MTNSLEHKKCVPCEEGVEPLTAEEIGKYLSLVEGWALEEKQIVREFAFKDFSEALAFVNEVGKIAESEGHHPDIFLYGWNKVKFALYTHAIGGLHMNDFVVASKINARAKTRTA